MLESLHSKDCQSMSVSLCEREGMGCVCQCLCARDRETERERQRETDKAYHQTLAHETCLGGVVPWPWSWRIGIHRIFWRPHCPKRPSFSWLFAENVHWFFFISMTKSLNWCVLLMLWLEDHVFIQVEIHDLPFPLFDRERGVLFVMCRPHLPSAPAWW